MCDKRDSWAITSVFCCDLYSTLRCFGFLQKLARDLFKGMCSLAEMLYYIIFVTPVTQVLPHSFPRVFFLFKAPLVF